MCFNTRTGLSTESTKFTQKQIIHLPLVGKVKKYHGGKKLKIGLKTFFLRVNQVTVTWPVVDHWFNQCLTVNWCFWPFKDFFEWVCPSILSVLYLHGIYYQYTSWWNCWNFRQCYTRNPMFQFSNQWITVFFLIKLPAYLSLYINQWFPARLE